MNLVFFSIELSIMDLLEMKLYNLFICFYEVIISHDLGRKFNRLAQVDLGCCFRLFLFFFRFHPST